MVRLEVAFKDHHRLVLRLVKFPQTLLIFFDLVLNTSRANNPRLVMSDRDDEDVVRHEGAAGSWQVNLYTDGNDEVAFDLGIAQTKPARRRLPWTCKQWRRIYMFTSSKQCRITLTLTWSNDNVQKKSLKICHEVIFWIQLLHMRSWIYCRMNVSKHSFKMKLQINKFLKKNV